MDRWGRDEVGVPGVSGVSKAAASLEGTGGGAATFDYKGK